jgi:hypothetical protein
VRYCTFFRLYIYLPDAFERFFCLFNGPFHLHKSASNLIEGFSSSLLKRIYYHYKSVSKFLTLFMYTCSAPFFPPNNRAYPLFGRSYERIFSNCNGIPISHPFDACITSCKSSIFLPVTRTISSLIEA